MDYPVIGNRLLYPTKWGKRKAAMRLIDSVVDEQERIIANATAYRDALVELRVEVDGWVDDEVDKLYSPWRDGKRKI
jgi:hypothetical protein